MPLSWFYNVIINARNALYDKGAFKSHSLGVPVVSIGNITVGGTGKTPLVALVAEILADAGETVCILTRGYGRENSKQRVLVSDGERILATPKQSGDEPLELARKLAGKAFIVADANRVAAGNWARKKFGITAFVLDDAFQHRRVERDLDIVCVDATNPFGNGKSLPSGILREPLENLKRADAIVITRTNLIKDVADLKRRIAKYNSHCPIFVSENRISNLIDLKDFHAPTLHSQTAPNSQQRTANSVFAFCALGNPENFFEQLRQENYDLTATEKFPDHHFYTSGDIEKLSEKAKKTGAKILLTTAKDVVKLKNLNVEMPCYVVEIKMIFDDADNFRDWLLQVKNED
ncbi:MAG: tetraacyldisaccharide 4'-kinase [Pyrinomonadaceae bacterium]